MNDKYNGWHNYETWRINLEIFDGYEISNNEFELGSYALKDCLSEYAYEIVMMNIPEGLCKDYASAFLDAVNWYEIADHLIENYRIDNNIQAVIA